MKTHTDKHNLQSGFAHLGLILAVVGVLVVGGLVAWRFLAADKANPGDAAVDALSKQLASAKCEYDDKDICKFFVSYKAHKSYSMNTTMTDKASGEKSTMKFAIDGDNYHTVTTGSYASEQITIGKTAIYTKTPNGTWWKQTITENKPTDTPVIEKTDLEEPSADNDQEETKNTTSYKPLGKEACGSLTCFKYQVVEADRTDSTDYIWFDTKSYQLRRSTSDTPDQTSDTTFVYDSVKVTAPSNYKELGPNQYIMPGQDEPSTMPTGGDFYQN